ncbi:MULTISPECIES: NAD-dependent epimerase/dehydratase family protein [unclassified Sphingomonas]|uniref:NAD-dependent epimerase/dehydratase family protein n=1 Tax=unclassified Sphingomonas TaxID=196159 RepID=UPI0021509AF6|nr:MULTISPECIES: NAD-dependent epimerase/dehydratase family protein [unclassified Sphingomonas]MCR5870758.1 NAD-dependent epimerase/dehydratase family protein [Sphingomonas sp. J344]UUY00907.1 NAD-dependent epimerase/dehydratase family protein [Sphingomonas sp. J315]
MRLAITGAAGFVGRSVVRQLAAQHPGVDLLLADREVAGFDGHETLEGDLTDPTVIAALTAKRVDAVLHLAALPGGAAEHDPAASRAVNLDMPLALIEAMRGRRLVIAGSIAVFGGVLPDPVDEATVPTPTSVYGTHKRMVELAFGDAVRRGAVTGFALRLPGIVARPAAAGGFGSAFLSGMFHSALAGKVLRVPVAPDATSWLMSVRCCAANLVAAALGERTEQTAVTLPALRVTVGNLVAELGRHGDVSGIRFEEVPATRATFGSYPQLVTPRADALGFRHDGNLTKLVETVIGDL